LTKLPWKNKKPISLAALLANRSGNIALTFAILLVPLITAVGMSLDFARAYNVRSKMQANLDAALLAAVKNVGTKDSQAIETQVKDWFAAQADLNDPLYSFQNIDIDTTGHSITATATAAVPTTLLKIANVETVDVAVSTSVSGPGENYLNVYVVLDKSASMLLAATASGQTKMRSMIGCEFACHSTNEGVSYKNTWYSSYYSFAKKYDIQLRADVSVDAVSEVLDLIDVADSTHKRIKVGLYTAGMTATEVLAPTFSTSKARKKLAANSAGLNSATSEEATFFDYSLDKLKTMVGPAGDGSSASSPLKLVLLLTDGVQSERNWIHEASSGFRFPTATNQLSSVLTPLNPDWCGYLKGLNASVGVLYTKYLPLSGDWGYEKTVGQPMSTSRYKSVWGGTMVAGVSSKTTRHAYIPIALEACASSDDLFISANSSDEISTGLSAIFQQYLSNIRLTN